MLALSRTFTEAMLIWVNPRDSDVSMTGDDC
jgi:hypothetical protein